MAAYILKPSAIPPRPSAFAAEVLPHGAGETLRRSGSWRGASGRRYLHTVYSLLECPPLPDASYILVRRVAGRAPAAVAIDACATHSPSLNLARIRQTGARLGATEVHVHLLGATPGARMLATCDLQVAHFGALSCEPQATNG